MNIENNRSDVVLWNLGLCCNIKTGYQNAVNGQQAGTYTRRPLQRVQRYISEKCLYEQNMNKYLKIDYRNLFLPKILILKNNWTVDIGWFRRLSQHCSIVVMYENIQVKESSKTGWHYTSYETDPIKTKYLLSYFINSSDALWPEMWDKHTFEGRGTSDVPQF